jgi:hypothetical protein
MENRSKNTSRILFKIIAPVTCFFLLLFILWMFLPMQIGPVRMSIAENTVVPVRYFKNENINHSMRILAVKKFNPPGFPGLNKGE